MMYGGYQLAVRASPRYFKLVSQLRRPFYILHPRQSGHNKWSKIKDKKGANDMQKSIIYSKASHEILTAARVGGSDDPNKNVQLDIALKRAKEQGVPKENIAKALSRASGDKDSEGHRFVYEALAYDSVGLIIECMTDNVNRTLHNVREILTSHGARMTPVRFMFERQGLVTVALTKARSNGFNQLFDIAIENQADDLKELPDKETDDYFTYEVSCAPNLLAELTKADWKNKLSPESIPLATVLNSELAYVPKDPQILQDEEKQKLEELVQELEANNDTSRVWTSVSSESVVVDP